MSGPAITMSLSPYDQSMIAAPAIVRLFHYASGPDIDRLRHSFQAAVSRFPRLGAEIVRSQPGFALAPLTSPPSLRLRHPVEWEPAQFSFEQLPAFVDNLETVPGRPVLAASLAPVTHGVVLGLSMSHCVGDGYSLYLFQKCWAEEFAAARQGTFAAAEPDLDNSGLERGGCRGEASLDEPARARLARLRQMKRNLSSSRFSSDFLDALRRELSTEQLTPSVNEAITAFLVHRYGAKMMGHKGPIRLRIPVDIRGIDPRIGSGFFGNAFVEAVICIDELDDTKAAALRTLQLIRHEVSKARDISYVRSCLRTDGEFVYLDPGAAPFDREKDIVSSNISRMRLHQLQFGQGPPARYFVVLPAPAGFLIGPAVDGLEVHFASERVQVSIEALDSRNRIWGLAVF
jgi:hypothetical protein